MTSHLNLIRRSMSNFQEVTPTGQNSLTQMEKNWDFPKKGPVFLSTQVKFNLWPLAWSLIILLKTHLAFTTPRKLRLYKDVLNQD